MPEDEAQEGEAPHNYLVIAKIVTNSTNCITL